MGGGLSLYSGEGLHGVLSMAWDRVKVEEGRAEDIVSTLIYRTVFGPSSTTFGLTHEHQ